jgi:hypothetical protein
MEEEKKETPPPPPPILDQLKEYAETQIKLAKYEAIDRSSKFMASFITDIIALGRFCLHGRHLYYPCAYHYLEKR